MDHTKGITIGGLHTYRDLGLVLVDGSEAIGLPELQTYSVEVPGRNGILDLTEAHTGDVTYKNRTCSWQFADAREYGERTQALYEFVNLVHGKRLEFRLDDRLAYTCTGRFTAEVEHRKGYTYIDLEADCDPFFTMGTQTYKVYAAGGVVAEFTSGRKPVSPTFEFQTETIVSCNGVTAKMQPGTYTVNDLWFREGVNQVYLNSHLGDGNVTIERYAEDAIQEHEDKIISLLMWDGLEPDADERYAVYVQYERADL